MAVNYDDERFKQVEEERNQQIANINNTYQNLINERNDLTNQQNAFVDQWNQTQNDTLDKQLQLQKDLIEQQRQKSQQAYEKEARSAYTDYRRENDEYGVSREQMANAGLANSGYSESSRVGMYNAYQNRLAVAKESMDNAKLEFDNAIREAQLNNDVTKAQNALTALQQKLDISLEGFNYKSTMVGNQLNAEQSLNNNYYSRYQNVLNQINLENQQAEAIRQWEAEQAFKQQQADIAQQQWEKEYALAKNNSSSSSSSSRSSSSSSSATLTNGSSTSANTSTQNKVQDSTTKSLSGTKANNGRTITVNPHTNSINPDAKYGVYDYGNNAGYQPNNIGGKTLKYSGQVLKDFTGTSGSLNAGGKNIDDQKVWQLGDRYYTWDGYQNSYVDITDYKKKTSSYNQPSILKVMTSQNKYI